MVKKPKPTRQSNHTKIYRTGSTNTAEGDAIPPLKGAQGDVSTSTLT